MAYYALINENNEVVHVISGVDEFETQTDLDGTQVGGSAEAWEAFYASRPWFAGLKCKRTSFNTANNKHSAGGVPFRGNFAAVGYLYDPEFDVFLPPRPYESWTLDYSVCAWVPPVPMPAKEDGHVWKWSEYNKQWIKIAL